MYSFFLNQLLLPAGLRLSRSRFLGRRRAMARHQFLPAAEQRAGQLARLRTLVAEAAATSPFYREQLAGIDPESLREPADVTRLPALTKAEFQANFPDRVVAAGQPRDDWQYVGSRGTTNRVVVIHDFDRRDRVLATNLLALGEDSPYRLGRPAAFIPPDDCSTLCGPGGQRESTVLAHALRMVREGRLRDREAQSDLRGLVMENWVRRTVVWEPFGPDGTHLPTGRLERYVRRLEEVRPVLFKALPEYLRGLARFARESGRRLPAIPLVKPMGAHLAAPVRAEIDEAFGTLSRMDYGCREMGSLAFDCRYRDGLHVLTDQFLIEVVRDGAPVPPGEVGNVLVTDLWNRATPLIRYQIGDIGRMHWEPCPCGRQSPRLWLEGRLEDTVVTPAGRVLTPERWAGWLYAEPGIDEFQLSESPDGRVELRYVPRGTGPDAARLEVGFRELVGDERRLVVRRVESILPEKSGKFRHVKSASFGPLEVAGAAVAGPAR